MNKPGRAHEALGTFEILPMGTAHIPEVVAIYLRAFEGAFLASLGQEFLSLMFTAFLEGSPRECSIVCVDSGKRVVGFVCGSRNREAYVRSFIRRYIFEALPAIAKAASRDRRVALGLWRRAWLNRSVMLGSWLVAPNGKSSLPSASLMTVAVATDSRNKGLGTDLVRAFMDEMMARGVRTLRLAVAEDNLSARRVYEQLGWQPSGLESGGRARSRYYVRAL